uniref:B-related factor 1 n=1 Tax=Phallusia mammillata TaxID=59560 RepID=A0A6F9D7Z1_9ASCI|nr:transcription factor IIIB 90 kDa subunit [Phallusia mammillata]
MSKTCPHCKSSDLDVDPSRGDIVCKNCGSVLEENSIVSEVTIQENADGSSSVVGQFVSSEGSYKPYLNGFQYGLGKESRQVTLDKGKQSIRDLAALLKLNKHCIDTAYNFFKMAISKRLSRGRRISHIVAACLYMTCRTEGTPHLLLDFSDITQVNVFTLGKVFLLLAKELHINLPVLDPCMYITRFAHRLDFGEKTNDVTVTALRLVSRMKRDWLHTGRRPSGLCGAALLVAARLHGFNCDLNDIVKVVKIGHETIRKRLTEFESTPSSQLTINEFMNIDLEAEHDPPAFYNGRIKTKIQQLETQAGGMTYIETEIGKLSHAIDDKLAQGRPDSPVAGKPSSSLAKPCITENGLYDEPAEPEDPDLKISASFVHSENPQVLAETFLTPNRSSNRPKNGPTAPYPNGLGPTVASLGLNQSVKESLSTPSKDCRKRKKSEDGELDLDGIDDEEIDRLLLTPRESEIKSKIWVQEFGGFVKEMEEKRQKKQEEQKKKARPFRNARTKRKEYYGESRTAGEALEKLLSRQKLSNKIDYEALRKATEDDKTEVMHPPHLVIEDHELQPSFAKKKKNAVEACIPFGSDDLPKPSTETIEEFKPPVFSTEDEEEGDEDAEEDGEICESAGLLMQKMSGYPIDIYN